MVRVRKPPPPEGYWGCKPIRQVEDYVNPRSGRHDARWLWQCVCAKEFVSALVRVKRGHTKSCGCSVLTSSGRKRIEPVPPLEGFWGCLPLERTTNYFSPRGRAMAQWLWRCACGEKFVATAARVRSGHTRSCGCLQRRLSSERSTKPVPLGYLFAEGTRKIVAKGPTSATGGTSNNVMWLAECLRCGRTGYVSGRDLRVRRASRNACRCLAKSSKQEAAIFAFVNAHYVNVAWGARGLLATRQCELDIWLEGLRAGVEYDGGYWHTRSVRSILNNKRKDLECATAGIALYRIAEADYLKDPHAEFWKLLQWLRAREATMKSRTESAA